MAGSSSGGWGTPSENREEPALHVMSDAIKPAVQIVSDAVKHPTAPLQPLFFIPCATNVDAGGDGLGFARASDCLLV